MLQDGVHPDLAPAAEDFSWRDEVSARLHRYRARRRPRAPRYPSLRLKFEAPETRAAIVPPLEPVIAQPPTHQALAIDPVELEPLPAFAADNVPQAYETPQAPPTAKIIEFPRSAYAAPVPLQELADPVIDRPRILEAPEVLPPPPALGGITIEDAKVQEPERRPGIDMPLQVASRRFLAVFVDALLVLVACVMFGAIAYRLTGTRPPVWEMLGLGIGLPSVFWAGYQYLFIVYSGTTLGLRAARLRLVRFDGSPAARRIRRWRVLASFLSGVALAMGYAWQFLDEDSLCWHERVTCTYLAPLP